ncbi:GINS complex subunit [Malassezia yamatoensis]|uniref:GINS complex subunit n=1 Tax=Malassezia yamatoensis TaxID=253288 RepID=A0AAJ5YQ91_9BASI|nr:GINS complex subunit [Malassezia yamatoensis]
MSHARYALSDDEDESFQPTQTSSLDTERARVKSDEPTELPPWESEVKDEASRREDSNIIQLTHAWLNERGSPEILPWNAALIEGVMDQIAQQQSILDSLMPDASTSEEEHFRLNLVQLDVERAIWLLRSYLRARISKFLPESMRDMNDPAPGASGLNQAGGMSMLRD